MARWEDDGHLHGLLEVTADWLDVVRRQALSQGLNALEQYNLIESRVRRVAASASTAEEATSQIHRLLMQAAGKAAAPSNSVCSEAGILHTTLTKTAEMWGVSRRTATGRWLDGLLKQTGLLTALLRLKAQTRREEFEAKEAEETAVLAATEAAQGKITDG